MADGARLSPLPQPASLAAWRSIMIKAFRGAGIEQAELDARLLICHAVRIEENSYFLEPEQILDEAQGARIKQVLDRRLTGEPVSRILGVRAFWKHEFLLGSETLDPRPDSETAIETALALVGEAAGRSDFHILDLGTGTGALLISLLLEWPQAHGTGVDVSGQALEIADKNARKLGCAARAAFIKGNWLETIDQSFDLIICNPPYIATGELAGLSREVRDFDPLRALDGGKDGYDPYRQIIPLLQKSLKPGGLVIFEIGIGQHVEVAKWLEQAGLQLAGAGKGLFKDLSGRVRCVAARKALLR